MQNFPKTEQKIKHPLKPKVWKVKKEGGWLKHEQLTLCNPTLFNIFESEDPEAIMSTIDKKNHTCGI